MVVAILCEKQSLPFIENINTIMIMNIILSLFLLAEKKRERRWWWGMGRRERNGRREIEPQRCPVK